MHRAQLAALVLGLLFAPLAAPRARSEDGTAQAEILALLETYATSARTLDWDALLDLYADDERFSWMESGDLAYEDKQSVVEHVRTLAPMIERLEFEVLEPRVLVLSSRYAHASMRFREGLALVSGQSLQLEGAMTMLLVRTAAGWRLLSGHTSISPRPETPPAEA